MDSRITISSPKERGFELPIGILEGGKLNRTFKLKELGFDRERSVGKYRRKSVGLPYMATVSKLLALLLSEVGGKEFKHEPEDNEKDEATALLEIGKLWMPDVYYMYVMARLEELGPDYEINYGCPACGMGMSEGEDIKIKLDLSTMDVFCVTEPSILRHDIPLFKGLKYRDGTVKKIVTIQPMQWIHMCGSEMSDAGGSQTLTKLHFISKCVIGVEGVEEAMMLTPEELGSLRKIDIEKIGGIIQNINLGPALVVKGECPKETCKNPFNWPIDWDYDSFFTIASQS